MRITGIFHQCCMQLCIRTENSSNKPLFCIKTFSLFLQLFKKFSEEVFYLLTKAANTILSSLWHIHLQPLNISSFKQSHSYLRIVRVFDDLHWGWQRGVAFFLWLLLPTTMPCLLLPRLLHNLRSNQFMLSLLLFCVFNPSFGWVSTHHLRISCEGCGHLCPVVPPPRPDWRFLLSICFSLTQPPHRTSQPALQQQLMQLPLLMPLSIVSPRLRFIQLVQIGLKTQEPRVTCDTSFINVTQHVTNMFIWF